MKQFLSTLSVAILSASSGSLFANNIATNHDNQILKQEEFTGYWNFTHIPEVRKIESQGHGVGENPQMFRGVYRFKLGPDGDKKYSHFSFVDQVQSNVEWGSTHMGTWNLQDFDISFDQDHNYLITNINDEKFFFYLKYKLFDEKYHAVLATLLAQTYLGYTWFSQEGNVYLQILVYEYINVMTDFSLASNEINLGTQIKIT